MDIQYQKMYILPHGSVQSKYGGDNEYLPSLNTLKILAYELGGLMVKNTKRILAVLLSLVLIIMNVASVYASGETDTQNDSLLIDVQNIEIASGSVYDLSASTSAANVLSLTEGTMMRIAMLTSCCRFLLA